MDDTKLINHPLHPPLSVKKGVSLAGVKPPLLYKLRPMSYLWFAFFDDDQDGITITSGSEGYAGDGVHGSHSLHYTGNAIDLRVKDVDSERAGREFCRSLIFLLGIDYDIVFEGDHIHVEYDPESRTDPSLPTGSTT